MTRTDDPLATESEIGGRVRRPTGPAAVLWDMDGTLVDTEPYWFAAERDLVDRHGHGRWPDEHAHAMVGFDLLDSAAYMQQHGGVDLPAGDIVELLLDGVIARLHREIPWRPGARELLAELGEAGVPCALVTMSWRRFVDPVLAALPAGSFVATITGDEVPAGHGKPSPTPYELGAQACGAHPADCVAIEDSPTGVRSALSAGCRVIGVPNVKALAAEPGLTVVDTLTELDVAALEAAMTAPAEPPRGPVQFDRPKLTAALAITLVAALAVAWWSGRADEPEPVPLPPGAVAVDAWAPYWTLDDTLPETSARFADVREMSPFWFETSSGGEIVVNANAPGDRSTQFVSRLGESPPRFVPSISDELPAGEMAAILADPTSRAEHVATVVEFAAEVDADGIDLDYERFAFSDGRDTWAATRPNWVAFVTELADELHADDRTLTVSIPPIWGLAGRDLGDDADPPRIDSASGYWVYDHAAIAEVVDRIRIMAYDYSVAEAGPIAPLWWVEDLVSTLSLVVPEEHHDKLVLGVGPYGRNWVMSTLGDCPPNAEGQTSVFARSVLDLAAQRGGLPVFDEATAEWTFDYALTVDGGGQSCVQNRRVHWVDAEGVGARTEVARRAGWGGVALWALGYEDDEVWSALLDASRRPLAVNASE